MDDIASGFHTDALENWYWRLSGWSFRSLPSRVDFGFESGGARVDHVLYSGCCLSTHPSPTPVKRKD